MKTIVIIPSRLSATRLPGKPLLKINGKSIISHVVRKAQEAKIGEVFVAAEDKEIVDDVRKNKGQAILSKKKHKTGTDRVYEALNLIGKGEYFVLGQEGNKIFSSRPPLLPFFLSAVYLLPFENKILLGRFLQIIISSFTVYLSFVVSTVSFVSNVSTSSSSLSSSLKT